MSNQHNSNKMRAMLSLLTEFTMEKRLSNYIKTIIRLRLCGDCPMIPLNF